MEMFIPATRLLLNEKNHGEYCTIDIRSLKNIAFVWKMKKHRIGKRSGNIKKFVLTKVSRISWYWVLGNVVMRT